GSGGAVTLAAPPLGYLPLATPVSTIREIVPGRSICSLPALCSTGVELSVTLSYYEIAVCIQSPCDTASPYMMESLLPSLLAASGVCARDWFVYCCITSRVEIGTPASLIE